MGQPASRHSPSVAALLPKPQPAGPLARALVLACLCLGVLATPAGAESTIRVRGSKTYQPFMQSVAEDYMARHPSATVVVSAGGSLRGYKAVLDDTADIAIASGPMPPTLRREFARRGVAFTSVTVGHQAVVAAVHPSLPVNDLSRAELREIFTGRMAYWPAPPGAQAQPIEVILGIPTGGITLMWRDLILKEQDTFTAKGPVLPQLERARLLAQTPHGITFLAMNISSGARIKRLSVDGVPPTADNVRSGAYALRSALILTTRESPRAEVAAFMRFLDEQRPDWRTDGLVYARVPATAAKP